MTIETRTFRVADGRAINIPAGLIENGPRLFKGGESIELEVRRIKGHLDRRHGNFHRFINLLLRDKDLVETTTSAISKPASTVAPAPAATPAAPSKEPAP